MKISKQWTPNLATFLIFIWDQLGETWGDSLRNLMLSGKLYFDWHVCHVLNFREINQPRSQGFSLRNWEGREKPWERGWNLMKKIVPLLHQLLLLTTTGSSFFPNALIWLVILDSRKKFVNCDKTVPTSLDLSIFNQISCSFLSRFLSSGLFALWIGRL